MRSLSPDVNDIAGADFKFAVIQQKRARPAADEKHLVRSVMCFERARAAFLGIQQNRKIRPLVNDEGTFYFGKTSLDLRTLQDVMNLASKRRRRGYRQRGGKPHEPYTCHAPNSIYESLWVESEFYQPLCGKISAS